jgi:hypothetical protein
LEDVGRRGHERGDGHVGGGPVGSRHSVDVGRLVFLEWDAGIKELKGIAASGLITLLGVSPFTMISINV